MNTENRKLIVVGDRVLIAPLENEERTKVGLYLPQTVVEKQSVQTGRVIETGPGIPYPEPGEVDEEPWKRSHTGRKYIPMEAQIGDYAIFLKKSAVEIEYNGKHYLVVPQAAILVLLRDTVLDEDI
ncbi:co-chaperone GroES [candidate division KSB1 bacterium]|nr:MAG: co-chaperone GroES [candidate division KSB1 bacterium]